MPDLILNPTYTVSVRNGSSSKFTTFNWAGPTDNDPPLRLYRCGWKFDLASLPAGATITGVTLDIDVDGSGAAGNLWSIGPYGGDGAGDIETDAASTIHTGFDVSADNYIANADFTTTGVKNLTLTGAEADLLAQAGSTFCLGCRQNAESVAQTAATLDHATTVPVLTISYTTTSSNAITVDVPIHTNLEWGVTHELAVTDDTGTVTLAGVTLSAPTGWETVAFTTAPNPATTESFYEYAQTDTGLGGAGYTMLAGDILAWETQTGLTIDGQTIPQVDPPATVSGSYKVFKDATKTWTSVSTFTITDLGFPSSLGIASESDSAESITPLVGVFSNVGTSEENFSDANSIQPSNEMQPGVYPVTVTAVRDSDGLTTIRTFNITVLGEGVSAILGIANESSIANPIGRDINTTSVVFGNSIVSSNINKGLSYSATILSVGNVNNIVNKSINYLTNVTGGGILLESTTKNAQINSLVVGTGSIVEVVSTVINNNTVSTVTGSGDTLSTVTKSSSLNSTVTALGQVVSLTSTESNRAIISTVTGVGNVVSTATPLLTISTISTVTSVGSTTALVSVDFGPTTTSTVQGTAALTQELLKDSLKVDLVVGGALLNEVLSKNTSTPSVVNGLGVISESLINSLVDIDPLNVLLRVFTYSETSDVVYDGFTEVYRRFP